MQSKGPTTHSFSVLRGLYAQFPPAIQPAIQLFTGEIPSPCTQQSCVCTHEPVARVSLCYMGNSLPVRSTHNQFRCITGKES